MPNVKFYNSILFDKRKIENKAKVFLLFNFFHKKLFSLKKKEYFNKWGTLDFTFV